MCIRDRITTIPAKCAADNNTPLSYKGRNTHLHSGKTDRKLDVYKRQVYRSENAGMSSANVVRIHMAGNLRFLEEGSSAPS